MTKSMIVLLCLAVCVGVFWVTSAGDLDPPGPPAPTMVTLQQLYDKIGSGASSPDTCFDNVGRFVVCGNGTVKDSVTGLFWLQNPNCLGFDDWASASIATEQLAHGQCNLTDGSSVGDWRMPTKDEWQAIVDQAAANGCSAPFVPDVVGTGCCGTGTCAFTNVQPNSYWSSTTQASSPQTAFTPNLNNGIISGAGKSFDVRIWAVRSGR